MATVLITGGKGGMGIILVRDCMKENMKLPF